MNLKKYFTNLKKFLYFLQNCVTLTDFFSFAGDENLELSLLQTKNKKFGMMASTKEKINK